MAKAAETDGRGRGRFLRAAPWVIAALLLLLPLVAMRFTAEVNWDETDFIVMGALLFGACGAWELAARMTGDLAYRAGAGVAIVGAFLLVWINLAVGVIGSEDNPANLMFGGVLAVGAVGAAFAGLQPDGMARALIATAVAQGSVGAVALVAGWGAGSENWPQAVVFLTGFFVTVWLTSAGLFRTAARKRASTGAAP